MQGVHTDLSCEQLGPPSDCNLTVYFNRSLTRSVSTLGCSAWEPQSFCDGVKSLPSPRGSPELELLLNRTSTWTSGNVIFKAAMWPLLYFHGGPACNIVLQEPRITDVTLAATLDEHSGIHESSQVRLQRTRCAPPPPRCRNCWVLIPSVRTVCRAAGSAGTTLQYVPHTGLGTALQPSSCHAQACATPGLCVSQPLGSTDGTVVWQLNQHTCNRRHVCCCMLAGVAFWRWSDGNPARRRNFSQQCNFCGGSAGQ